jgi:hypothetical protein
MSIGIKNLSSTVAKCHCCDDVVQLAVGEVEEKGKPIGSYVLEMPSGARPESIRVSVALDCMDKMVGLTVDSTSNYTVVEDTEALLPGRTLSRYGALAHPEIQTVYDVIDEVMKNDYRMKAWLSGDGPRSAIGC